MIVAVLSYAAMTLVVTVAAFLSVFAYAVSRPTPLGHMLVGGAFATAWTAALFVVLAALAPLFQGLPA